MAPDWSSMENWRRSQQQNIQIECVFFSRNYKYPRKGMNVGVFCKIELTTRLLDQNMKLQQCVFPVQIVDNMGVHV